MTKDGDNARVGVSELIDGARAGSYRGMTLGLHEGSLELDANDKGGGTRQDLQGL